MALPNNHELDSGVHIHWYLVLSVDAGFKKHPHA